MYFTKEHVMKALGCEIQRFKRFLLYFNIKETLINNELLYSKRSIERAFTEIKNMHDVYKSKYFTIHQCKQMKIPSNTISNNLSGISIPEKYRFYEYKELSYLYDKNQSYFKIRKEFIRFSDAIEILPFKNYYCSKNLRTILETFDIPIDYTIERNIGNIHINDILKLKDIVNEQYKFNKEKYITLKQCRDMGLKKHDMLLLSKKKPELIDLVYEFESVLMLYDKKSAEELLAKKIAIKNEDLICEKDILLELGFYKTRKFDEVLKMYDIKELKRNNIYEKKFYKKKDFKDLKKIIFERYKFNKNSYYSTKDLNKFGIIPYEITKLSSIKTELIDQVFEYSGVTDLYPKPEVDSFISRRRGINIIKEYINEKEIKNRLDINLKNYAKSDNLKGLIDLTSPQLLPFARKYNLKLRILSIRKIKPKATDTYFFIEDIIKIREFKEEKIQTRKLAKETTCQLALQNKEALKLRKIEEKEATRQLALQNKEALKLRKIEKEAARQLALQNKEALKLRKIEEKEAARQLALQNKETLKLRKIEKEAARQLALQNKEALKLRKIEEKEAARQLALQNKEIIKLHKTEEQYIRTKMFEYKNQLLNGVNIKSLFLKALRELNYIKADSINTNEFNIWVRYLIKKLNETSTNGRTLYRKFCRYIDLTRYNQENNFFIDLPSLSTKELNTMFFNRTNYIGKQEVLYSFLKFYSKVNEVKYNFLELKNPFEVKRKITEINKGNKEIYPINDYLELIKYVSDISIHKKQIEFYYKISSKKRKYRSYQSIWLYVILTLNNMWRNYDLLTKVPIIQIPPRFQKLEEYFEYDLTLDEAKIIIAELTSKLKSFKNSKSDQYAHFFCSEELILPLANALVACVLYKEATGIPYVIEQTPEFTLSNKMQKEFFKNFSITDFKFKSKKMNSTIATFSYEYIKKYTNENPIVVTSLMRPHTDINTTNYYINLPQDEINQITNNLFEGGYFGYTFDYMYKLITGECTSVLEFDKKKILLTVFKEAHKIENISAQLLFIEQKYTSLHQYLNELTKEDIAHQLNLINLKQLPAKEEHWQCILGECLYLDRSCISCPFAIPHFYSLTLCIENLTSLIETLKNRKFQLNSETKFLVGRIFQYLQYLSDAKKKFGSEFLNEFSNGRFNVVLNEILNLSDFTNYLNSTRGDI